MQMAFLRQRLGSAPPAHPSALAGEHASRTALGAPSTAWPGWAPQGWGRVSWEMQGGGLFLSNCCDEHSYPGGARSSMHLWQLMTPK